MQLHIVREVNINMDIEECKESYKVLKRNKQVVANIDKAFPIDYRHMSMKAIVLGQLLLEKHFKLI